MATTTTITFPYDGITGVEGVPQFWTVPPKVYYATFRVFGAQGGRVPGGPADAAGGRGGEVTAKLAVNPGELLEINVGGMPGNGIAGRMLGLFGLAGFNGGGRGGAPPFSGGGGGGASDVRRSPFGLTDRLLVAGGGGGGGSPGTVGYQYTGPTGGGAGGGESGRGGGDGPGSCGLTSGQLGEYDAFPLGGGGGGTKRGGSGGVSCGSAVAIAQTGGEGDGGHGAGGDVAVCTGTYSSGIEWQSDYYSGGGGGGGGGYYGGGGGGAGGASPLLSGQTACDGDGGDGGGGGSGFGPAAADFRTGARGGNGLVTLTFTPNCSRGAVCVRSVPGAPTDVEAAAGNHKAKVAFVTPRTSTPITYKATASPGGEKATGSSSPISVSGLKNGTEYTFTVTATNELGTGKRSKRSNQVTPAPPPGAPRSVMAVALNHEAVVSFTVPKSRWSPIVGYKVIVQSFGPELDVGGPFLPHSATPSPSPGGGAVPVAVTLPRGSGELLGNRITVSGLKDGVMYEFMVKAINGIGPGPPSSPSNSIIPVGPPNAPAGVIATAGNAQATITFDPPYANGSRITIYTVTASPGGATATGKRSPITVTGLTNGTSYTFSVTAANALGTGPASAPSNAVTPLGNIIVTGASTRTARPTPG